LVTFTLTNLNNGQPSLSTEIQPLGVTRSDIDASDFIF
jgi:hypothetical protein